MMGMQTFKDKTILYAEDDINSRAQMTILLEMLFGKVHVAANGEEAWRLYNDENFDILLTDIKMPIKDGLKLIQHIRESDYITPIVLLTSFADQHFLLKAVNLSVDGYIIKPINFDTLVETLSIAFKRVKREEAPILLDKNLFYNSATKELCDSEGATTIISAMELKLLTFFIKNQNIILTKEQIADELWPLEPICESAIKNIVFRLRKKIGEHLIVSVYGIGYRMKLETHKQRGIF